MTRDATGADLAMIVCRSVGGMRASIYNAMPEEGVNKLIAFMKVLHALTI